MPPQTDQNPSPSQPSDFDFMLKQESQQKKRFGLPGGLGTPAKLLIAAVGALIIAIIAAMVLGGGENNSEQVLGLMAQNQEIVRVSLLQDQKFRGEDTKGLSATTQAAMNSQKLQLGNYLSSAAVKYDAQRLAARTNTSTDTELQTAAQNNNLDSAYTLYLKNSLTEYLNSLTAAYQTTQSQSLKGTLESAFNSVQTLLKSPQFKT